MSLADIREQIKTILAGVPGIGVVHDYERWAVDETAMLKRFQDADGRINACEFARKRREERFVNGQEVIHIFTVRRIMGLKDSEATGIIFDDHLDLLAAAFQANDNLNGACMTTAPDWGEMSGFSGLQIDVIEPRMFGNVLCHVAECRLAAVEA